MYSNYIHHISYIYYDNRYDSIVFTQHTSIYIYIQNSTWNLYNIYQQDIEDGYSICILSAVYNSKDDKNSETTT